MFPATQVPAPLMKLCLVAVKLLSSFPDVLFVVGGRRETTELVDLTFGQNPLPANCTPPGKCAFATACDILYRRSIATAFNGFTKRRKMNSIQLILVYGGSLKFSQWLCQLPRYLVKLTTCKPTRST